MKEKKGMWKLLIYYICTIIIIIATLMNYNLREDKSLLALQIILIVVFILLSVINTIKYLKDNHN